MPFGFGRDKEPASQELPPDHAPGWDALEDRLSAAYPGQEPHHWKPDDVMLPAQDGVWGISAYQDEGSWFYVTFGLTDLFDLFRQPDPSEVEPDAIRWSGFGFELTMRVLSSENVPPDWPVELLMKLGKYVYKSKVGFEAGHRLDPGGRITGGNPETRLTALVFWIDPVLEAIDTPMGRVEFVTVFGITADELARMKELGSGVVVTELQQQTPLLITDPSR